MSMIKATNLVHEYIRRDEEANVVAITTALNHVDIDVKPGQFIAILGHNGSGKSTLAKHLNGLLFPDEGTVWIGGYDTKEEENLLKVRQTTGMVFQNPDNQIIGSVVEEDVAFGLENIGVETEKIWKRVAESLEAVGMTAYREQSPNRLSGGQKQRVAIAGVMAMRPRCIVLDESTAMLDPVGRKEVIETISQLNKEEGINCKLEVVPMQNYRADMDWAATKLPWVQTSPRIPTAESAYLYCVTGALGNGNLSVGIGTGKPFHFVASPFMDAEDVKQALDELQLPGMGFRATAFIPEAGAYTGKLVQGVEVYVLDKDKANLPEAGYAILQALRKLYPGLLTFKERGYGLKGYKIDTNLGETSARDGLPKEEVFPRWQREVKDFAAKAKHYKLYQ